MKRDIRTKRIGLFVENGISRYIKNDKITLKEMITTYLENNGFFALGDDKLNLIGYLDISDLQIIKDLLEKIEKKDPEYKEESLLKDLITKQLIDFRKETINPNEKLIDVLKKLDNSEQNYFPIVENNILLGRISKKILKEKIEALY